MSSAALPTNILAQIAELTRGNDRPVAETLEHILQLAAAARLQFLTDQWVERCGTTVRGGPFEGMRYLPETLGSVLLAKLLGCYEAELHGILTALRTTAYQSIVNIGCGEGYYAVGLARLFPQTRVHAFDSNPRAQELCRELAQLNEVAERVAIGGTCNPAELRSAILGATLILCDCEGGERQLLDPAAVPALAQCELIVETHQFLDAELPRLLEERFAGTHAVIRVAHAGRDPNAYPPLRGLSQLDQSLAVWEQRPGPTPWLYLRPHVEKRV